MLIVFFARKGKYLLRDVAILLLTQIISRQSMTDDGNIVRQETGSLFYQNRQFALQNESVK